MALATNITDAARLVKQLKIDGFCTTSTMDNDDCIRSRWSVGGYEWEICVYPGRTASTGDSRRWVALQLIFLSEAPMAVVRANLGCKVVDRQRAEHSEKCTSAVFRRPKDSTSLVYLISISDPRSGYLRDDSLTVDCTITVLKESPVPTSPVKEMPVPSSNLHKNLGDLLQTEMGADVTFLVRGESFAAHKLLLPRGLLFSRHSSSEK